MRYIDQSEIYRQTNAGRTIFEHYYSGYDYGNNKAYLSLRDGDKTPSARIIFFDHFWRVTDFGNQQELNGAKAIEFVMWKETLEYYEALLFIESVIIRREVGSGDFKPPRFSADYEYREMTPDDKKGEYNFIYKKNITEKDCEAFGRYVTPETLERFNCRSVESYEYCSQSKKLKRDVVHKFIATDDYPMFIFDYPKFKKLYRPHEKDKKNRFLYIGEKPKEYVYGLAQLNDADCEFVNPDPKGDADPYQPPKEKPNALVRDLFRCSGESDAMNLASLGFHVYWLNSESADYPAGSYQDLDSLCENHYQIMDTDFTGRQQALKVALKHIKLFTVELPEYLRYKTDFRGNPCKDLKDFINTSGNDQDATRYNFLVLKRRAKPMQFWERKIEETKSGAEKITYNINLEFYYFFLQAHGFYVMDSKYHKRAGYCYCKIDGKKVQLISPEDIKKMAKRFTKDWIRSKNLMDEIAILNKINSSNQISEANLQEIAQFDPCFKNYDANTEVLNFKNGSLRITLCEINKIKHDELPNFILTDFEMNRKKISHMLSHNITLVKQPAIEINPSEKLQELTTNLANAKTDAERELINFDIDQLPDIDRYQVTINDKEFIFSKFLKDLSHIYWRKELEQKQELSDEELKEQNLLLANLMFTIGYQCSEYKDPSKPWLSLLQDLKISDVGQSSGRSGKSLLTLAISKMRPSFYVGGRKLDDRSQYNFIYDGFTEFHNNIEVDDFAEYGDFNFFYTQITGKREVNSKNLSQDVLDYQDSGKMLISTNFEIPNMHSSTLARMLNCAVSDYYHEKTKHNDYKETRTPQTKFGKLLFDNFDNEEWNHFYNLVAYCIQLTKRFHKIQPPMANLEKRQALREMTRGLGRDNEFFSWASNFFMYKPVDFKEEYSPADQGYYNTYVDKEKAFTNFKDNYLTSTQAAKYKAAQFKKAMLAYCEYYGYEFNPLHVEGIQQKEGMDTDPIKRRIIRTVNTETKEYIFISTIRSDVEKTTPADAQLSKEEQDDLPF